MKLLKAILPAVIAFSAMSAPAMAASEINERDTQAVREHIQSKRDMRLSDKHDDLTISADVRFEYKHLNEEIDGVEQRGNEKTGAVTKGKDEFDTEVNIYLNYETERTFAKVKLEFDNDAGIIHKCGSDDCGSGQCNKVCLEIAFFGIHVWEEGTSSLDVSFGRQNLDRLIDSRIQFQSQFDGIFVDYHNAFDDIGGFHTKAGLFVVDSLASNWAYFVEVGLTDIAETGLDLKYSFIDWTHGQDRAGKGFVDDSACVKSWNFQNSQFTATYNFRHDFIGERDIKLYGGFVVNHAAKKSTSANGKKENLAFYVGGMIGKAKGEGNWSVDANYQWVQAQAIADYEVSGIGRGNCAGRCYATDFAGNGNFHGFLIESLYCFTDNLKLDLEAEFTWEQDKAAGGGEEVKYQKYEIEFIYSF